MSFKLVFLVCFSALFLVNQLAEGFVPYGVWEDAEAKLTELNNTIESSILNATLVVDGLYAEILAEGDAVAENATNFINLARDSWLGKIAQLESMAETAGVSVEFCTSEGKQYFPTLANQVISEIGSCIDSTIYENDLLVQQTMSLIYQTRLIYANQVALVEACRSDVENPDLCVAEIIPQIDLQILAVPVIIEQELGQVKEILAFMGLGLNDCQKGKLDGYNAICSPIYDEIELCVLTQIGQR